MQQEKDFCRKGTDFQKLVWQELLKISYGKHITYGEQARRLGRPKSARAVGAANGKNPIGIIIPCHRVIGASGHLTGFAGGIEMKRQLLDLERADEPPYHLRVPGDTTIHRRSLSGSANPSEVARETGRLMLGGEKQESSDRKKFGDFTLSTDRSLIQIDRRSSRDCPTGNLVRLGGAK